jgi:YggT family protein
MLNPFTDLVVTILQLYSYVLIAWLILSWLIALNVVNRHQPAVQQINRVLFRLTEPVLKPIRKRMPDLGNIDISPIILILIIGFLERTLIYYSFR